MAAGHLCLVLHAHLPWCRHAGEAVTLEESWLFEAIWESYVPLLLMLDRLAGDGVPVRLTLSLSPVLLEMLADGHLMGRFRRHLDHLLALAEAESARDGPERAAADHHARHLAAVRDAFDHRCGGDLPAAFAAHARAGRLDLVTTAATHGYLPLLWPEPGAVRGQIDTARRTFRRHFGRDPEGLWLPECGYTPGLDGVLATQGVRYTFLEAHGLLHARPVPPHGVTAPARTPAGVAVLAREPELARRVWSAGTGYPGAPAYREFHRDLADRRDTGTPGPTGLKLWRITGRDRDAKAPYAPDAAARQADADARRFVQAVTAAVRRRDRDAPPVTLTCPFDAELFGHWWFEGPYWLERVFRHLAATDAVAAATPGDVLADAPQLPRVEPAASSWGEHGYHNVWLNTETDWLWPHLHRAARTMAILARDHAATPADTPAGRTLRQAGRELLLAQASDWPFMLRTGTAARDAEHRLGTHLGRFRLLADALRAGGVPDPRHLTAIEAVDTVFPALAPGTFR